MAKEFKFPDLGEGITEGEIKKWLVKVGEKVAQDQSLAEVETDKAVVEMPSPAAGTVLSLSFKEGETVKVGEVLAVIGEAGEAAPAAPAAEGRRPSISVVGELPTEEVMVSSRPAPSVVYTPTEVKAVPAVRKLAKDLGVDLGTVKGSGAEGRITEEDVRAASKPAAKPAGEVRKGVPKFDLYGWVERLPIKGVRKVTAKHMMESQMKVAAVTAMDSADVTDLVALREKLKEKALTDKKVKLTYMPFIIKGVAEALKLHPLLNSVIDDEAEQIVMKKYYNIGMAVAIDEGLIVPVIKAADQKDIFALAEEVTNLANLAKDRKLDLADLKGGTFTITNYGIFGSTYGTPIINYPEVAILGTGKIMDTPVVIDGEIRIRKILPLSLTFDHRAFDGAEAGRFMTDLKKQLESPELLLLTTSSD
ncbi:MAG: branched-chain alpha-keto acid dehydrogenase subunit E2 [Methanomassiliicoccales archaeon PtaU1.Bin124]|nr:MAG: branched-chain alpha-keto acid dehydrogenase subunit E2 [Methanomassiliicoccales archaeon PtaU1.Bin124]